MREGERNRSQVQRCGEVLPARSLMLCCTSRDMYCTCSDGTRTRLVAGRPTTRTSGKCDSEERRGARYDGAPQDGRSAAYQPSLKRAQCIAGESASSGDRQTEDSQRDSE
ncbi:PREDICTED: uncharacterized protein LOC105563424 [Vollenhovia emeryi]|uniref:uncharacterized protein LOC105563424 n=1 Tax=Vollenhovia emeryi TaxID=411798 RepID=UPI0005F490A9|nr:PREDICTED: uncharacterized protein LOC105563424 [Vollenhovia emeryi]